MGDAEEVARQAALARAGAEFAEAGDVGTNFLGRANGEDVAGGSIADARGDDPDDIAVHVQNRGAAVAGLDGHVHAEVRGRKLFAVLVEVPAGDEADGGADFALTGKADRQHGVRNTDGVGVSQRHEWAEAIGF